ncbi:MAG TPA: patatin-like protein [Pyrinomonadaceae bacterium]|nr:patatin-like protein [Pyrinomonadaceae bacterium]
MAVPPHQAEYTQEVRFAVVMYGGVSLAIYINGIAQELLRMVRSTSSSRDDGQGNPTPVPAEELKGTERVYRRLSCLLSDPQLLKAYRESIERQTPSNGPDIVDQRMAENTVNTRFVVDILSGTSAGGINAIYLAKALANDQNLDELKGLWVTEGDIALLINDKKSVAGLHLTNQQPPQSLLNSRRMYFKLLKALHGMEKVRKSAKGFVSPHVDELDLFITTTDIEGTILPLRLSDTVVYERRHRNVFHFKYATPEATGTERNDFLTKNDPFLAFAARCTSSFPFAFEPMRLCDIDEILDRFPEYDNKQARKTVAEDWKLFFKETKHPLTGEPLQFIERSYGDGGYLDNKPFTYATETLLRRDAPVIVDRKLIYIEPSPEHPEDEPSRTEKYQALENVKAALLDLPTYETIREDLQRLMDRNELIKRVHRITTAIEGDLDQSKWQRPVLEENEWASLDLAGMVQRFGIYYIPYRRLRISSTTDELAKLVARSLDINVQSAQFTAVRHLVHAWRDETYPDYHQTQPNGDQPSADKKNGDQAEIPPTANQFLIDFDYKYWLRRVTFIRGKIDQLYKLIRLPAQADGNGVDETQISAADAAILERLRRLKYHPLEYSTLSADRKKQIQKVLVYLKCELSETYKNLRTGGRTIQSKPNEHSSAAHQQFAAAIKNIKLSATELDHLLGLPPRQQVPDDDQPVVATQQEFSRLDDHELTQRAKDLLFEPARGPASKVPGQRPKRQPTELGKKFQEAGAALRVLFHEQVSDVVWPRGRALLRPLEQMPQPSPRCKSLKFESGDLDSIREYLWRYFSQFDDFDQISFPILFGTEVGEADVVEVLRISPEDATSLIDERAERHKAGGRQKLAGTALHHFGAFLDQVWRQNDILWGRLDGAERLITSLLPEPEDKNVRAQLISEAHSAILIEELSEKSRAALHLVITDALVKVSSGMTPKTAVSQIFPRLRDDTLRARLGSAVQAGLENEGLLEFIKSSYEVNRDLDPKIMLRSIARSTQVIGKMFEDMANQHQFEGKRLAWIARMGQFFWGLVEVAVPGSLLNLLFFHWLKILYAFEIFLIVGSILLNASKEITNFGWLALGLTAALNVIVLLLGDYIRGKGKWWRFLLLLVGVALLFLATIGLSELLGWGWKDKMFSGWAGIIAWLRSHWP